MPNGEFLFRQQMKISSLSTKMVSIIFSENLIVFEIMAHSKVSLFQLLFYLQECRVLWINVLPGVRISPYLEKKLIFFDDLQFIRMRKPESTISCDLESVRICQKYFEKWSKVFFKQYLNTATLINSYCLQFRATTNRTFNRKTGVSMIFMI